MLFLLGRVWCLHCTVSSIGVSLSYEEVRIQIDECLKAGAVVSYLGQYYRLCADYCYCYHALSCIGYKHIEIAREISSKINFSP